MGGILVYALHDDEGVFNKNSLGALSEASRLAGELGVDAAAVAVGEVSDEACAELGKYGVAKVYRAKSAPEGLAQPIVDVMAKVIAENDFSYALFGGGLLGFEPRCLILHDCLQIWGRLPIAQFAQHPQYVPLEHRVFAGQGDHQWIHRRLAHL